MNEVRERARRYRVAMLTTGIVMIAAPVLGMMITVGGMMGAFESSMGTTSVGDPGRLSENIGEVLIATAIGVGVAAVTLPAFIIFSVLLYQEKRKLEMMLAGVPDQAPSWADEGSE